MTADNIPSIIAALQDALLRKLGDEVDLVFQYGSYIRGATHRFSDVDVSYVPVHEGTWESITVLVEDRLVDLYPMHWSTLERMAEFRNPSASVLLHHRILYARTGQAAARMAALGQQLTARQQPQARPEMVRRALETFQSTSYDYYLLRMQAAAGHAAGCLRQAQSILRTVLHCLAVVNQACVDTRKLEQVAALPKVPAGFAETAARLVAALEPAEVLAATETLLDSTRDLLLAEQRACLREATTYPAAFGSGYPELRRDLQGVMLECERGDLFALKGSLLSLLHEVSRAIAQAETGVVYSGFNTLAEYEQDLVRLGFPALLPCLERADFAELGRRCLRFDTRLREFLTERGVGLNAFATVEELAAYLAAESSTDCGNE